MSLLVERRTERIDLGDGDWVEIVAEPNLREYLLCQQAFTTKGLADAGFDLLELMVVAWSEEVPLVRENFYLLRNSKATPAIERIRQLVMEEDADPKVSSSPSAGTSKRTRTSRT